jgi:legumain
MFSKFASAATLATVSATSTSDHWAVIVAGSNGYGNYRHQADTCHAYQLLKKNGIPEDQIIHLSYDDVANSRSNPFPGKLFNKPTAKGTPGDDVYAGCKIDYSGKKTTAANVINVLKGDAAAAGGPVLKSDENSKVFFYFADHGAPGLVAMPVGGYLYADKFHETLKFMNENKMYKEMVVYIEACESGSMFENILEDNLNIYAVTAANAHESSWGTYCAPDDKVDGKSLNTCLGDLFSVNWLEDSEKAKMNTETLEDQYKTVQKLTAKSHVLQFGQLSLDTEPIADFQSGTDAVAEQDWWKVLKNKGKMHWEHFTQEFDERKSTYAVDSRDIKMHYLYNKVMQEATPENHQALQDEITHRMKVDSTMEALFGHHFEAMKNGTTPNPTDFECYRKLINRYEEQCESLDDYSLKYLKTFAAECEAIKAYPAALDATMHRLDKVCPKTA